MKEKIVIGEKMTKRGVIKNYLMISFYGIIAAMGYKGMISPYVQLSYQMDIFVMVMIYIVVLLFLTPIIGSSETLEFSQEEVRYFHVKGYFQQFIEVLRIIRGKPEVADIILKTEDIQFVHLSYTTFTMMWAQKGYQLKMTFFMNDASTAVFFPTTIGQMEKGDYELALQMLETKGVEVKDRFQLRKALSMDANHFYEYVKKVEEGCH